MHTICTSVMICMSALSPQHVDRVVAVADGVHSVRFAILGDRTGGAQPGVYERVVREIERLKPDFVVTVGDMIEGPARDQAEIERRWQEYEAIVSTLSMPVYYTPGNNDIWNDQSLETYRDNIGEPFFSFDHSELHCVILDNSRWESREGLPAEQLAWLDHDLSNCGDVEHTFVFYHKPFWFETTSEGRPDTLHRMFRARGVDGVFTGHYHAYFSDIYDTIRYTNVGSSGGYCEPGPTGLTYHFVLVTVTESDFHIAPIRIDAVLPWDEITATQLKRIDKFEQQGISFAKPVEVGTDLSVEGQEIEVTVASTLTDWPLDDTLSWHVPEGWAVQPAVVPITVQASNAARLRFELRCTGQLYPVPTLSVRFPFADGRTCRIERGLAVARRVDCQRTGQLPVIDGKLSEALWTNPVFRLFGSDGRSAVADSTFFYFSYDENYLYLGARCMESHMESLSAGISQRDGAVYGEDCVGYFFQPSSIEGMVYQIYFNAVGTVFDQVISSGSDGNIDVNRQWNGSYHVATNHDDYSWTIEIGIPVSQFGLSNEAGQRWRLNFRRKQRRLGESSDWQVPISYDPSQYGFLDLRP